MTALTKTEQAKALKHNVLSNYAKASIQLNKTLTKGSTIQYMRYSGEDGWTVGRDYTPVSEKDRFAVDFCRLGYGVQGWFDGDKVYEELVPIGEDFKPIEDLPPIEKVGPRDGYALFFNCVGVFFGQELPVQYGTTTYGGKKFFNKLLKILKADELASHEEHPNPVLKLTQSKYFNKKVSREIWEPDFELMGWCDYQCNMLEDKELTVSDEELASLLG